MRVNLKLGNKCDKDEISNMTRAWDRKEFESPTEVEPMPSRTCTGEFCSWTTCVHGSVQILLQIAVVFTRLRVNFKTSRFNFIFAKQPSKNITGFQTLIALSEQIVARFGCLSPSVCPCPCKRGLSYHNLRKKRSVLRT